MKKRTISKILSLIISVCTVLTCAQIPLYSQPVSGMPAENRSPDNSDFAKETESIDVLENGAYTDSELCVAEDGRIRLAGEEPNLYTRIYRNRDGSNTMEVFDAPVKFIDSSGTVKDKLLTLTSAAEGFEAEQSDSDILFSAELENGIRISNGALLVETLPEEVRGNAVISDDGTGVVYSVDEATTYRYSLTYTGYKEEIVVSEYTGQTEYRFRYLTNGLALVDLGDGYGFADENGGVKATLSEILVFTADDRNNTIGETVVETVRENEEYLVTLVLTDEYLSDPLTAYPIVIDPSIDIIYEDSGAAALEDATINSTAGTSGSGTSIFVGLRSTKGIARLLVRFPGLDLSPVQNASCITSAKFRIRDLMCYSTQLPVECHVFNSVWSESTVNWTNTSPNNYNSAILDSHTVYYNNGNYSANGSKSNIYEFNILSAVRGWKSGTYNQSSGIIFKTTNAIETGSTNISACFASYERNSNKPKLFVTYNDTDSTLVDTNIVIDKGSSHSLRYICPSDVTVSFSSSDSAIASVSSSGVIAANNYGRVTVTVSFSQNGKVFKTSSCIVFVGEERYIFFKSDGKALAAQGYSLKALSYGSDETAISWVFVSTGVANEYYIIPRYTPYWALAADTTGRVYLTYYAGTVGQKWIRNYSPGKLTLKTALTDSAVAGKNMYRNGTSFELSSSSSSNIYIPTVQGFVPATGISLNNIVLGNNTSGRYISSKLSPDNASAATDTSFFKYTSGNRSIVSFDDPDRKNYMKINGMGHTTVTVEHLIYGLTATAEVTVYDATDYRTDFDENGVTYIVSGGKYMEIPSDPESSTLYGKGLDDYIDVIVNPVNTEYSHQMWRFAKYGSTPYYVICSMHSDNQVLYYYSDNSICTWTTNTSTYGGTYQEQLPVKALWGIVYDSTLKKNKIVSAYDTTKAIYITSDNKVKAAVSSAITNSGYIWSTQTYVNDAFWGGTCCKNLRPYDVVVAVDTLNSGYVNIDSYLFDTRPWGGGTNIVPFEKVKQAVEKWNNISPKVKITCKELKNVTSDETVMSVIVDSSYSSDNGMHRLIGAPGCTVPVINGQVVEGTEENMDDDWMLSNIYISTESMEIEGYTVSFILDVITHEVGHALKLKHIVEEQEYMYDISLDYRRTFPSTMAEIRSPNSRNDYIDSLQYIAADYITNYDKSALKNKWENFI